MIKQYTQTLWLISLGLTFFLAGCDDYAEVREKMVQDTLKEKLEAFRIKELTECREDALKVATIKVDSILIARAKASKDSLNKPPIPDKPTRPDLLNPLDSSEVGPILQKNG
ncbi:MAG: hypothetical protein KDC24_14470 [Saprospiraceae bacterium]|nr:hypothetical protein [Saprospiraceae bacterium]